MKIKQQWPQNVVEAKGGRFGEVGSLLKLNIQTNKQVQRLVLTSGRVLTAVLEAGRGGGQLLTNPSQAF